MITLMTFANDTLASVGVCEEHIINVICYRRIINIMCYGVATISRLLEIIGLFCKRALQ